MREKKAVEAAKRLNRKMKMQNGLPIPDLDQKSPWLAIVGTFWEIVQLLPFSEYRIKPSPVSTNTISDDGLDHQSSLPSLDLSSRCSNQSRVLSPEHANELARSCSGEPLLVPSRICNNCHPIYLQEFANSMVYNIATSLSLSRYCNGGRSCSLSIRTAELKPQALLQE